MDDRNDVEDELWAQCNEPVREWINSGVLFDELWCEQVSADDVVRDIDQFDTLDDDELLPSDDIDTSVFESLEQVVYNRRSEFRHFVAPVDVDVQRLPIPATRNVPLATASSSSASTSRATQHTMFQVNRDAEQRSSERSKSMFAVNLWVRTKMEINLTIEIEHWLSWGYNAHFRKLKTYALEWAAATETESKKINLNFIENRTEPRFDIVLN